MKKESAKKLEKRLLKLFTDFVDSLDCEEVFTPEELLDKWLREEYLEDDEVSYVEENRDIFIPDEFLDKWLREDYYEDDDVSFLEEKREMFTEKI